MDVCVCVCGRMGARVLAPQNDGGLGPGLMRCFRDNARRRVDMWFGRGLYAIFYSLFLITYFSVFFTLPFLSPALHPHHLSAAFSYPQSGGWQWQIEEHRSSTSTRLEGQIITGYFPPPFFFFPEALVIHVRLQSSWGLSFQDALCHFVNNALCSLCHISDWINMKISFFFLSAAYFLTWLTTLLSLHSVLKEKDGVNSLKWDSNIQISTNQLLIYCVSQRLPT